LNDEEGGALIAFDDVTFAYPGGPALFDRLCAVFPKGRVSAVAGPNGAGKSTLLKLAAGLLLPSLGRCSVGAIPLGQATPLDRAKRVAYVPQNSLLPGDWPVKDIVALGDYPHREKPPAPRPIKQRLNEAREALGLQAIWERPAATLSGGEAQRVVLARALVQETPALLLDEAASHLDLRSQVMLHHLLGRLAGDGRSILLATHDVNFPRLWGFDLFILGRSGHLAPFPNKEEEQGALLEKVYHTPLIPTKLDGITCWFPDPGKGKHEAGIMNAE
jgi:iron complex transport system ATP-binding protein